MELITYFAYEVRMHLNLRFYSMKRLNLKYNFFIILKFYFFYHFSQLYIVLQY